MIGIAIIFGSIVGFALGLTGGGGGVFAVPLLVYGLAVAPREAVGISLASVGGTALFGVTPKLIRGEVELRTGVLFAVSGMFGAPIGNYLSSLIADQLLLFLFGVLMFVVAYRMWQKSRQNAVGADSAQQTEIEDCEKATCQRDSDGKLRLTSRCAMLLALLGLITGILSGMFGVGGGFIIVPALVLFSGMKIHQAVATSLLVIVLVSISGVSTYVASGGGLQLAIVVQFLVGGFAGMWLGGIVSKRLQGPALQKVFAIGVVLVAIFVISKSVLLNA
ncbi:sulfite exporter TauE/SafE family protein [Stieleria sp. JC731]|uniref:sulfite exporter TauE/SafE family protein n=1 Tax=Pirellulaceae TaxID=2691357 RepID=UPI0039657DDB